MSKPFLHVITREHSLRGSRATQRASAAGRVRSEADHRAHLSVARGSGKYTRALKKMLKTMTTRADDAKALQPEVRQLRAAILKYSTWPMGVA